MGDNHDKNRSLQRDARALAKKESINYTAALRKLLTQDTVEKETDDGDL